MNGVVSFYQREGFLYGSAIVISLLLSIWVAFSQTVINPDAICYLSSAEMVGKNGLSAAMHLCGQARWPFYSVLIYGAVKLSHLSYETAAHVLNSLFTVVSVFTFMAIVKLLGGTRRVVWLAAAVILLSHQFNAVREYIVRDHGFWAFYLLSFFFLLQYFQKPRFIKAVAFTLSLWVATLFRIEGVIFLIALPHLAWFSSGDSFKKRLHYFLSLNALTLMAVCCLVGWLWLHPEASMEKFGRVADIYAQFKNGIYYIGERYAAARGALADDLLSRYSVGDAGLVLLLTMVAWYVVSVMNNVSWIFGLLALYAMATKRAFSARGKLVLAGYTGVNVLITLAFLFENMFLSKRYLIALSLILMLWVPFALNDLIQKWADLRYRLAVCLIALGIITTSLGGILDFGYSKTYISNAGKWLSQNVPASATLYANDFQLMYYSNHFGDQVFETAKTSANLQIIADGKWKNYDYVALRVNKKEQGKLVSLLNEIKLSPVQTFSNERGDQIIIFNTRHREK